MLARTNTAAMSNRDVLNVFQNPLKRDHFVKLKRWIRVCPESYTAWFIHSEMLESKDRRINRIFEVIEDSVAGAESQDAESLAERLKDYKMHANHCSSDRPAVRSAAKEWKQRRALEAVKFSERLP